jgi:hypothetical protein
MGLGTIVAQLAVCGGMCSYVWHRSSSTLRNTVWTSPTAPPTVRCCSGLKVLDFYKDIVLHYLWSLTDAGVAETRINISATPVSFAQIGSL